jgi:hypothetical protein
MRRRQLLTASAIAIAGVAGCSGGTGSEEATETEASGGGLGTPEDTVATFYDTLYGEDDIEATNELYHPDSEAPELTERDFEPFGGVEAIDSSVEDTEILSESDVRTRSHVDVDYSTPAGSAVNTDWFVLRQQDGEWLVSMWLPESSRSDMSTEEAEGIMESA